MTLSDREKLTMIIPIAIKNSNSLGFDSKFTYEKLTQMKKFYPSLNDGEILEIYEDVANAITELTHHVLQLAWKDGN